MFATNIFLKWRSGVCHHQDSLTRNWTISRWTIALSACNLRSWKLACARTWRSVSTAIRGTSAYLARTNGSCRAGCTSSPPPLPAQTQVMLWSVRNLCRLRSERGRSNGAPVSEGLVSPCSTASLRAHTCLAEVLRTCDWKPSLARNGAVQRAVSSPALCRSAMMLEMRALDQRVESVESFGMHGRVRLCERSPSLRAQIWREFAETRPNWVSHPCTCCMSSDGALFWRSDSGSTVCQRELQLLHFPR